MTDSTPGGRKSRGPGDARSKAARQTRRLVELPEAPIVATSPPLAAPSRSAPEIGPAVDGGATSASVRRPRR